MKTAREWSKEYWGAAWMVSDERAIEARDAEHRAELLKLQDDLLAGANREVAMETEIERLKSELDEVKHDRDEWSVECTASRLREAILRGDAAPPPAESTPVHEPWCKACGGINPTECRCAAPPACPRCGDELPASMCQPQPAPSGDETDEEFHANCLNLTVDEARLICECGSGMRTHVFGGHRSCEYFEHHCDSCHERGICTAHVPVLSKLLALVPVPGAPSGDEAKVREILDRTGWFFEVPRDKAQLVGHDEVLGLLHAAYAAGKADGAREEREACEKLGRDVQAHYERQILVEQQSGAYQGEVVATAKREIGKRIADAIARRGSEGK